jgi:hypothetical protein
MNRLLCAFLAAISVSGCASEDTLRVSSAPVTVNIARPVDPAGVRMLPVNFRVVTRENLEQFMSEISRNQNGSPVFVAMTVGDYENLSLNLADIRRYIEQQQAIIVYYQRMTAGSRPSGN